MYPSDRSLSHSMENFISGYPGCEFQIRGALAEVVGSAKAEFFFDKVSWYLFYECSRFSWGSPVPGVLLRGGRRQVLQEPWTQLYSTAF